MADAFNAAFRIPNFLQNMFGEGVLSASFIPVYARLLAEGKREEAGRVAGAVFALLALVSSLLVLLGVLATPLLLNLIAPGFSGARRELAIQLVRIFFPGAGLLVLSAWCLGVLNSHRQFFLSYAAPIVWNLAIIAALILSGSPVAPESLARTAAWGSVAGSALQIGVQLPTVLRLLGSLRLSLDTSWEPVRAVTRNFIPVFIGRGVVQVSAFIDTLLASFIPQGAVAALSYAQILYTLPVSLFGMSVSAAELPIMSSALGSDQEVSSYLRLRLETGLRQIAYFVVPAAIAFVALGDVLIGALYQSGQFRRQDTLYTWGILAGSAVGLLASTLGRLYASTYYALRDTRTPLRFALIRVGLTTALGYLCAIPLPPLLGLDPKWGAAGLTASAGAAGWVEFALLRGTLNRKIGPTSIPARLLATLWGTAVVAAAAGWLLKPVLQGRHPVIVAVAVLSTYGFTYIAGTALAGVPEVGAIKDRVGRLVGWRSG